MKMTVAVVGLLFSTALFAALEPLVPTGGAVVPLIPEAQKKVMAIPTLAERIRLFRDDRKSGGALAQDRFWRRAKPLVLEVRTTEGEKGPWKVEIGKRADLSDARTWYVPAPGTEDVTGREVAHAGMPDIVTLTLPMANLEVATRYYWRISYRGYCGFGCHPKHGCKVCGRRKESPIASFVTEDLAPRWIVTEGDVGNIRDLGGRIGRDGRRIRQGLIYRGQAFNDNSVNGEVQGRSRLTVGDIRYLTGTLGIKTDLDLRGIGETADMTGSPLGKGVKHVLRYSYKYKDLFGPEGMKTMAENFRLFCDRKNYPVYFHCIAGADRTGSLAYVLNAVLGVNRQELETDWEATFYPNIPDENPDPDFWRRESHFNDGFAKYGDVDTPWNERIVLYLKSCGITDAEIETFRAMMLEPNCEMLQSQIDEVTPKMYFDYLKGVSTDKVALQRLDAAFYKVLREVRETVVTDKPAIWFVYNMGVVVKTKESCFSIDLQHRKANEIAPLLDFALITHRHGDHFTEEFYRAMDGAGKTVISNFKDNAGAMSRQAECGLTKGNRTFKLKDAEIRTALADHSKTKVDFTTTFEIRIGGLLLFHSGDCSDVSKLNPSRSPDLWMVHPYCGMKTEDGVKKFSPKLTAILHLNELGHARTGCRWTWEAGLKAKAKVEETGGAAVVPVWGERIF